MSEREFWDEVESELEAGETVVVHRSCGPSRGECKCNCPDSCDHKWDGEEHDSGDGMVSATCSRCGMLAIAHDMWVLP